MNDDIQQPNGRPIATAHSNRLQIDQLRRLIYHHINESNKFDLHRAQNTWKPFIQVKRDRGITTMFVTNTFLAIILSLLVTILIIHGLKLFK